MEITEQIGTKECGICVINSYLLHYYHKDCKIDLLKKVKFNETGISIAEFEYLCSENNLLASSYKCSFEEFKNFNSENFLTILLKEKEGLHYVICKRHKDNVKIYDSAKGEYTLSYDELNKKWMGVLILVEKEKNIAEIDFKKSKWWQNIDIKYVAVCIVVNSIIAILSIVSAKYFAIVLNDFLPQNDFKNIIILSLAFVLVYLLEIGGQYFANIFYNRKRMKSFNILSYRLLTVLGNKNSDFYQKINNEQFYMLNNICSSISEFHTTAIPMFITSNIFMLTTFIIIAAYNPLFILIALLIIITNGLIFIYDFKMKKKVNTKIINLDFKNISLTNDFINNKNNSIETALTINKMKENLSEINSLTNFKFSYENNINFFGHIGTRIINMILIILSVYLINKDDFSIPNLIYIFMIFEIFESNIRQTLNFINKKIEFDRYNEMYKTMIEINNDEAKLVIVFDQNTNFSKEYIKNNANTLVLKMWKKYKIDFNNPADINLLNLSLIYSLENYTIKISKSWFNSFDIPIKKYFNEKMMLIIQEKNKIEFIE